MRTGETDEERAALRVRPTRMGLPAVAILALCVIPLATAAWWLSFLLILPLVALAWVLRVGVDVGTAGVTVRAVFGHRFVPWSDVLAVRSSTRGDLSLVLANGRRLRLPTVRARHLSLIAGASGGHLPDPKSDPNADPHAGRDTERVAGGAPETAGVEQAQ